LELPDLHASDPRDPEGNWFSGLLKGSIDWLADQLIESPMTGAVLREVVDWVRCLDDDLQTMS
jgi:hypothetical protein